MFTNDMSQVGTIMAQSIDAGNRVIPSSTSITMTVGSYSDSSSMLGIGGQHG